MTAFCLAAFLFVARGDTLRMDFVRAVKNEDGEWLIDVLGVPFGGPFEGRDSDGEFFDADTQLWLDQIGKRPVVHYHGYDAKGEPADPAIIGQEISHEIREDGVWFRVALDKASEVAAQLWQAAKDGFLRASSGAIQHLTRRGDDGHIDIWPVAELSLMDLNAGTYPANPYAIGIPALEKRFKAANLELPPIAERAEPPSAESDEQSDEIISTEVTDNSEEDSKMADNKPLTAEDILALMDKRDAEKAERARIAQLEREAEEYKELKAQVEQMRQEQEEAKKGKEQIKRLPNPTQETEAEERPAQIEVSSKWDGFTVGQLGLGWDMLKAVKAPLPMSMYRAMHTKASKLVRSGDIYANHIIRNKRGEIVRELNPEVTDKAIKALRAVNPMQMADKAVKADELHGSDVTDGGDEWVPTLWSNEMWDLVRNEARIMQRFRQVEVMGESLTIPTLEGKSTVYKVAQTDDESELALSSAPAVSSKFTTGNVTLTPVKNMAWLIWTGELDEDSIVPILPSFQSALQLDLMEQIDEMLISGDTDTASTNNSDTGNGSIATTWHLLSVNGIRDFALENSNATDIGTLSAEDFLTIMGTMGTNGALAIDPERLFWVCDPGFYRTTLALGEVLTRDKNSAASIESGRVTRIYGSDFLTSDKYGKTDSNGQIHNTAGNNTLGSVCLVRPDRWVLGFGRQIRIESPARTASEIIADANHLIASFRIDFKNHSSDDASALGYNVTLV